MAYSIRSVVPACLSACVLPLALALGGCGDDTTSQDSDSAASTGGADTDATAGTADDTAGSGSSGVEDDLPFEPAGPDAAPDPSAMGPYPVGVVTVELVDASRPNDDGEPRRLVTEIWFPASEDTRGMAGHVYDETDLLTEEARSTLADDFAVELATASVRDAAPRDVAERFPVILFSHGSSGVRMQSTFLTEFLASHGYVVAAPDHLGNTLSDAVVNGGQNQAALFESLGLRPDDMMFVLEHLQGIAADPADPLGAIVDVERVGAAGHSMGALTTLRLLAQDRPIDVAVAQAPPEYEVVWFGSLAKEPGDITIPVMIQAGTADLTTPLEGAEDIYSRMTAPRSMMTINEAGHFTFSDMCRLDPAAIEAVTQIGLSEALDDGCSGQNIAPEIALPLQRHLAIGLFNGHLRDSPGSLELLTAEAADALAPGMFTLEFEG